MSETNDDAHAEDESGPERSMEDCLYAGLSYADFNMAELDDESAKVVEAAGELLVAQRMGLAVPRQLSAIGEYLTELDKDPWFKFGVDYKLGHAGTSRVMGSFDRFRKVIPVYVGRELGQKAQRYLGEAVGCYLLQFDVACIVFCRAAVESLLKDALQEAGHELYGDIRSAPTAGKVLDDAWSAGILRQSISQARRLKKSADHVLHRAVPDERILPQQALDSINDLAAVLAEVLAGDDGEAPPSSAAPAD